MKLITFLTFKIGDSFNFLIIRKPYILLTKQEMEKLRKKKETKKEKRNKRKLNKVWTNANERKNEKKEIMKERKKGKK